MRYGDDFFHTGVIATIALAACLITGSALASPAATQLEDAEVTAPKLDGARVMKTVRVSYADLRIDSAEGIATLKSRIRTALREVCDRADTKLLRDRADELRCRHNAWNGAMAQVDELVAEQVAAR